MAKTIFCQNKAQKLGRNILFYAYMDVKDFQLYFEVAIGILKRKDVSAVKKLKDFLQALPSPKQIEQTLALVVIHFAENDPSTLAWILENQIMLLPELDLLLYTKKLVVARLINLGLVQGKDYQFELNRVLFVRRGVIVRLIDMCSKGEWRLINSMLKIN